MCLAGCGLGGSGGITQKTRLMEVNVPLREPSWVPDKEVVLAVSEDRRRVVQVDVAQDTGFEGTVRSKRIEAAGENLAVSPEETNRVYLGRPESGEISALDTDTLRIVDGYEVGDSPSYVTLDVQAEVLFALSEEGTDVSSAELEAPEKIPVVSVEGNAETLVEAPEKGLEPAFWVAGPGGVSFYNGDPPERLVGEEIEATDIAVDLESSQRAYVAEGERVVALEGDPEGLLEGKLEATDARSLGEKVEHVASDEYHVFAVTESKLVAMRRESLEVVETLGFGRLLEREGIAPEGISGITAGTGAEDVYITFEGEPYMLSAKKP
jgi:hypothetical protein